MPVRAVDDKSSDTLVVVPGEGFWTGSSTLPHLHQHTCLVCWRYLAPAMPRSRLGSFVIGYASLRREGASRLALTAVLLALLIVVTAGASVIWMYIVPGDDKDFYWPFYTAIIVGIIGLIAFAATLRLQNPAPGHE